MCLQSAGSHRVDIDYANQPIPDSPFYMKVYDHNNVLVEGIKHGIVGRRSSFTGESETYPVYKNINIKKISLTVYNVYIRSFLQ